MKNEAFFALVDEEGRKVKANNKAQRRRKGKKEKREEQRAKINNEPCDRVKCKSKNGKKLYEQ